MKKLFILLTALLLTLSVLAACAPIDIDTTIPSNFQNPQASKPSNDDVPTNAPTVAEEVTIVGSWAADVDLADMLNEQFAESMDAELVDYMVLDHFEVIMTAEFMADGTCLIGMDEETFNIALEKLIDDMVKGFTDYLKDQGLTAKDFEDIMGESLESFIEASFADSMRELELTEEGTYMLDDDKLYINDNEAGYIQIALDAHTLTLVDYVGENDQNPLVNEDFKGLVFQKQ